MTPRKLFDYLDGKLPANEREEIEMRIAGDPTLQRELTMARKLHEAMPGPQEIIGSTEGTTERGAILGRRVAVAFAVLVFLNVLIGLWFIFQQEKKPRDASREAGIRQQLKQSLEKAAATALPTPNIEADEIKIIASVAQDETTAKQVIAAAVQVGGTGATALADESGIVVLVDIPKNREADFRQQLVALGALGGVTTNDAAKATSPNERKYLQIRIVKASDAPKP